MTKMAVAVVVAVNLLVSTSCGLSRNRAAVAAQEAAVQRIAALPAARSPAGQSSFRCRSLMEADLTSSYDPNLAKGLEGKLKAGANNVSVSIDAPQRMSFLSEAGFDAGVARGPEFQIVANTARELVASYFDGSSINTFVLNKSNGLAVWSKIRATFPVYDAPTGGQSFLACQ